MLLRHFSDTYTYLLDSRLTSCKEIPLNHAGGGRIRGGLLNVAVALTIQK